MTSFSQQPECPAPRGRGGEDGSGSPPGSPANHYGQLTDCKRCSRTAPMCPQFVFSNLSISNHPVVLGSRFGETVLAMYSRLHLVGPFARVYFYNVCPKRGERFAPAVCCVAGSSCSVCCLNTLHPRQCLATETWRRRVAHFPLHAGAL